MTKLHLVLFLLTMLLYFLVPCSMIYQQENVLNTGETFRFLPRPIDPYDAFRGRYVRLRYDNWRFPYPAADSLFTKGQTIYAQITKDTAGFAQINSISRTPFDVPNYIKTSINYLSNNSIYLNIPNNMQRYYMNETLAPRADSTYFALLRKQRTNSDSTFVYIDVKIKNGTVLIDDLYFNGIPINASLRQK